MRGHLISCLALGALVLGATDAAALDRAGYDELLSIMQAAREAEASVFAPNAWAKATEALARADQDLSVGKKQDALDKHVAEAREYAENARKASDVCRLALQQHSAPRARAREARAPELVPALYQEAEERFTKAAAKVESGDVKGGLKEAEAAAPLFDRAELEGIRVDILGTADRLIAKAEVDEAGKFALATLARARTARAGADRLLVANRDNREAAQNEARYAEYEARHASNIAQSVRALARNDQAWEKLMLLYEIQMDRAGADLGVEHLPFDQGPQAATDTLIARAQVLRAERRRLESALTAVSEQLRRTLARFPQAPSGGDVLALSRELDERIATLQTEQSALATRIQSGETKLAELSLEHAAAAEELSARREREERFRRAKELISPSEGEVLYNAANDIVLRLSGLSFESGKSDIRDAHAPLLEKVKEIIRLFPNPRLVIEGHTDTAGDAATNQRLSERRALAVMQYLRGVLILPADRITAMGYGADRPVASNQTSEGRAKNRRIDIIIMP